MKRKGRVVRLSKILHTIAGPWYSVRSLNGRHVDSFCARPFESVTGYKLKPGESRRVRIRVEEVK